MHRVDIMILAGEPSSDALAADLVAEIKRALKDHLTPRFFGIGGLKLQDEGVELLEDMTQLTVFGFFEALKQYRHFKKIFDRALEEAKRRLPQLIILVDFGGFNLRFAKAIRAYCSEHRNTFSNWTPQIVYYVPPQVWASRERRAATIASTVDLVVSIFPFERDWYRDRYPNLPVKYVGDPMATRFNNSLEPPKQEALEEQAEPPMVTLLPGSRPQEIERHLPLMLEAVELMNRHRQFEATIAAPSVAIIKPFQRLLPPNVNWQIGGVAKALEQSALAIASSGTVTRECAYLRVPTVVVYQLSWLTYQIVKRIIKVRYIAMPNILANEMVFPELIQNAATPTAIAQEALQLMLPEHREKVMSALERVTLSLGPPGASQRAAKHIIAKGTLII
ncbi:MAG: Lipid-A-disaccharide synthase [Verrucomicrobia subdivision 3 bacterium]|nr:Lipid-A-disaccharide synthase [Limisphaerales bacterium]MCS1414371.1 Lipid-A-disaccharide synthase [Limisphaerales bacterium]